MKVLCGMKLALSTADMSKSLHIQLINTLKGQLLRIASTPSGVLRSQFIRVGIHEGERVLCLERLPGGTIVIQKNRQQIAIGHQLARQILVTVIQEDGKES